MEYNPEEYNEILNIFKNESDEIIQELNNGFLKLEKNPEDKTPLKRLFQLAHSLKGAAKMIGLISIQDIVHKIEDILSYWKNDDVKININFFQIIYDVCDFLSDNIKKAVEIKTDIYDEKVNELLKKLNDFIVYNHMIPAKEPKIDTQVQMSNIDIDAIILELIFITEKETTEDDIEDILSVISDNLIKLSEIFNNTNYLEIKNEISLILNNINNKEINNLNYYKDKISDLRSKIYSVFKASKVNIEQRKRINQKQTIKKEEPKQKETKLEKQFNNILANLQKIKYEKSFINEVSKVLEEIQANINDEKVNFIITKTINVLNLCAKYNIVTDNDCFIVIMQCIYLAKRAYSGEENQTSNINFLIQRIKLVEEMLDNSKDEQKNELVANEVKSIVSKETYNNFNNNITPFELQEIKTLRVDISKLDKLIAQTGELLINGLKNQEHISNLSKIGNQLVKWNGESKKILNYIKYYEKRGILNSDSTNMSNVFLKKLQNFFNENTNILNDLNNEFTNLYNLMSEDDNKFHQTVLEMETIAKGIRVLPLATIFHSFPRMVRDIAKESNKKIELYITGSDTTVDKKIIEEIKMPLIHILRNSISHGIELPQDRIKNNKSETGIINLSAKQVENYVIITIEDDGYGINLDKIKEISIKKNLLLEEEIKNMTDEQIMRMIFLPGFSTNETINDISGRGVGLDVVKTKIANLNGDITIDSVLNKGCKVTIKVPLSMSSIKVFVLLTGNQKYTIPINTIKFVKKIRSKEIFKKDGQNFILFDEHSIPIYKLSDILEIQNNNSDEDYLTVIIMESQGIQAAFIVDKLLGSQEVFQKQLIPPIIKIKNINGFTTLTNGDIALIINPYELMRYTILINHNSALLTKKFI